MEDSPHNPDARRPPSRRFERVVVLVNRNAGASRTLDTRDVHRALRREVTVAHMAGADAALPAMQAARGEGADLLVVVGGDGTVTTVLSALGQAYRQGATPAVCLVPGGTMNVIAQTLGLRGPPRVALSRLGEGLRGEVELTIARRTSIRAGERLGLLWGVGLFANFLEEYQRARGGLGRAMHLLSRAAFGGLVGDPLMGRLFERFEASVTVDGVSWGRGPWTNLSAGGVAGLGFGFEPYTRAAERAGHFHMIAHALGPLGALRELPGMRRGQGMTHVTQDVARRVVVETDRPRRFGLDGDVYESSTRFEVEAGPLLTLTVPARRR